MKTSKEQLLTNTDVIFALFLCVRKVKIKNEIDESWVLIIIKRKRKMINYIVVSLE